ncbi:uncharacterized protein LOC122510904 [Leptopilina heterotoma]|uniref:uncharacterized protein LOC122499243 n=1 Tax=Leptopilina heterotoma TaxID=63436 RepID=UPI001CA8EEA7|nr:uncharacterized protein LOC122499243 [Leptopilina heterotoma]XP_043481794.1 uncharacterized protein LOC122510904 [Leptopilina heterotoma]
MTEYIKAGSDNLPKVTVLMVSDFFIESDFFNAAETRGVKAKKSEREEYGDQAIGYVELSRNRSSCIVRGKICPEHRVRNKPYVVSVTVDEKNEKIKKVECHDCAASAGGCKHGIAFLMWLHRRSEEPSPTSTICYWKKPTLSNAVMSLKYLRLTDIKKPKNIDFQSDNSFLNKVVEQMKGHNHDCQLSRYFLPTNLEKTASMHHLMINFFSQKNDKNVLKFVDFAQNILDANLIDLVEKLTRDQSNSTLWFELRYGRITASNIHEASKCKTVDGSLTNRIMGVSKLRDNEAMERGRRLENQVLRVLEETENIKVEKCGLLLNDKYPAIGASPDGIGENFVVEVKCPMSEKAEYRYISKKHKINDKYLAQIQLQMLMAKKVKGYFCMANHDFETSKNVSINVINYNEKYIKKIIMEAMTFWKKNIFPVLFESIEK